ncbi:MAG: prolipoprotein diacylglyceryl transferase family protein [Bacteroidales bacterium]
MKKKSQIFGKLMYSVTFLILIPIGLWYWALNTEYLMTYPALQSNFFGGILIIVGTTLMAWAMLVLKQFGKGLPMNAYPPAYFVSKGPYRLFRHPIYWGFAILMLGFFVFKGSASGLWLVSPITILAMIALVYGYEKHDLEKRFPDKKSLSFFDIPENINDFSGFKDRLASLFLIFPFLILCNFLILYFSGTIPSKIEDIYLLIIGIANPFTLFLSSLYLMFIPFMLKRKSILREWVISSILSLFFYLFLSLLFPEILAQYPPLQVSSIVSIPIFLIFISLKSIYNQSKSLALLLFFIALMLIVFQFSNLRSAIQHIILSIIIFLFSSYYLSIWSFLKNFSEKLANSWKEWIIGDIRIINHGFYAGLGSAFVILIAGFLAGSEYTLALLIGGFLLTISAALWAQIIEGSEKLKRPFGYYGSVVGVFFGSIVVFLMGLNVWVVLGVISVSMPWGQAIGRLRCLVNGCCHGCQTNNSEIGIRFFHPRSRVSNISGLKGELIHPTQLYSVLWLFIIGIVLFSLWIHHFPGSFLFGMYLILTGLGRFVEEAFRGEVQTPVFKKLRLYQWVAIVSIFVGILMTTIKVEVIEIHSGFNWPSVWYAIIIFAFVTFSMGVDFPNSNARFSRLV